jgi:hypothetical protein
MGGVHTFKVKGFHEELFGDDKPRGYYIIIMKLFNFFAMHPLRPELTTMYQNRPKKEQGLFRGKYIQPVPIIGAEGVAPAWHFERGIHRSWRLIEYLERDGGIKVPCCIFERKDRPLYVYEGHHRTGAAVRLGWTTVPALLLEQVDVRPGYCHMTEDDREELAEEQVNRGLPNTSRIHGMKIAGWTPEELEEFMYPRPHNPKQYYMKYLFVGDADWQKGQNRDEI